MTSLWGNLPESPKIQTPGKILQVQASALTELTNGIVVGDVRAAKAQDGDLVFELRAVAPTLNNYRVRILHVSHGVLSYPCTVTLLYSDSERYTAESEVEFLEIVERTLKDERLLKVIATLIGQARALSDE